MTRSSDGDPIGGRYRLIRRVGAGGMGTVWHARDELLERIVAIKEAVAFAPNGTTLATGAYSGSTYLWNITSGSSTAYP
jgi:hypothetical protein